MTMVKCPACREAVNHVEIRDGKCGDCRIAVVRDANAERRMHETSRNIFLTTQPQIEDDGEDLGFVSAEACKSLVVPSRVSGQPGGSGGLVQSVFESARGAAIFKVRDEAAKLGATHIFGLELQYSSVAAPKDTTVLVVAVYGTAFRKRT